MKTYIPIKDKNCANRIRVYRLFTILFFGLITNFATAKDKIVKDKLLLVKSENSICYPINVEINTQVFDDELYNKLSSAMSERVSDGYDIISTSIYNLTIKGTFKNDKFSSNTAIYNFLIFDYGNILIKSFIIKNNNDVFDTVTRSISVNKFNDVNALLKVCNEVSYGLLAKLYVNKKVVKDVVLNQLFEELLQPAQVKAYFDITGIQSQEKEVYLPVYKSRKNEKYAKNIPESYLDYKINNKSSSLIGYNDILNGDYAESICAERNKKSNNKIVINDNYQRYCRKEKKFKKDMDPYLLSRSILKTASFIAKYENKTINITIDSLYLSAIILQHYADSLKIEKSEKKIWADKGTEIYKEVNYLLLKINLMKNIQSIEPVIMLLITDYRFNEVLEILNNSNNKIDLHVFQQQFDKIIKNRILQYKSNIDSALKFKNINNEISIHYFEKAKSICKFCEYPARSIDTLLLMKEISKDYYKKLDKQIESQLQNSLDDFLINNELPANTVNVNREGKFGENFTITIEPSPLYRLKINPIQNLSDNTFYYTSYLSNYYPGSYNFKKIGDYGEYIAYLLKTIVYNKNIHILPKSLKIHYAGFSDGSPYSGKFKYDKSIVGDVDHDNVREYEKKNSVLFSVLKEGESKEKNQALAYLRAFLLNINTEEHLSGIEYDKIITAFASNEKGGDFRKVKITISFKIDHSKYGDFNVN